MKEPGEPTHIAGSRSVWVTYTNDLPTDFSVTFTTSRFNGFPDTTLAVYTGSTLQNLVPVVKNDNLPAQSVSRVTFLAKAGVTYRIAVDEGSNPNEWSINLNWEVTRLKSYTDLGTDFGGGHIFYDDAADLAVFRPSNGTWWIRNSHTGAIGAAQFGLSGDTPVVSDYDGDGRSDLAVTRDTPGGKIWYVLNSFDGSYTVGQWGLAGDKPVVGDYDYDGRADLAVFRPSNGVWYIRKSSDGGFIIKEFGLATDIPVSGDFKGTPAGSDIAVFRPSNGTWYVLYSVRPQRRQTGRRRLRRRRQIGLRRLPPVKRHLVRAEKRRQSGSDRAMGFARRRSDDRRLRQQHQRSRRLCRLPPERKHLVYPPQRGRDDGVPAVRRGRRRPGIVAGEARAIKFVR
jgi:hypothetical protein